jgi:hypothetical protein
VLALKASHPAAEREPGDAGVTHVTERTGKPEGLGFSIEITAEGASVDSGEAGLRIDTDLPHPREVDNDSAVAGREPSDAVAARPHGDHEILLPSESHSFDDVGGVSAARDESRASINDSVPYGPGRVVLEVIGCDDLAVKAPPKGGESRRVQGPTGVTTNAAPRACIHDASKCHRVGPNDSPTGRPKAVLGVTSYTS